MSKNSVPAQRQGNQAEQKQKKTRGVKAAVKTYFHQRPGVSIFINDLEKELGFTTVQLRQAISDIIREGDPLQVIVRAHEWAYKPNGTEESTEKSGERLYREVGKTKNGTVILESEDGVLGKFVELD